MFPKPVPPSLLSSDLVVNGNLESSGDVQIDGSIDGDVKSGSLTISGTGVVRGTIEADEVTIAGTVTGQIRARHVVLLKGAKVIADLIQDKLSIEPGAFLRVAAANIHQMMEMPCSLNTLERTKLFKNFLALSKFWRFWKTSWWHSSCASSLTFPGK